MEDPVTRRVLRASMVELSRDVNRPMPFFREACNVGKRIPGDRNKRSGKVGPGCAESKEKEDPGSSDNNPNDNNPNGMARSRQDVEKQIRRSGQYVNVRGGSRSVQTNVAGRLLV